MLGDPFWQVRKEAAVALGRLRAPAAVPALVRLLEADVPDLRRVAASALGELRAREAAPALERLRLADADAEVKKAAARALAVIGDLQ